MVKILGSFLIIFFFISLTTTAQAQKKKLDLDDLMIKGELHSDDRMLILSRQKNELKNIIKYRTNYRDEMLREIPPREVTKRKY